MKTVIINGERSLSACVQFNIVVVIVQDVATLLVIILYKLLIFKYAIDLILLITKITVVIAVHVTSVAVTLKSQSKMNDVLLYSCLPPFAVTSVIRTPLNFISCSPARRIHRSRDSWWLFFVVNSLRSITYLEVNCIKSLTKNVFAFRAIMIRAMKFGTKMGRIKTVSKRFFFH